MKSYEEVLKIIRERDIRGYNYDLTITREVDMKRSPFDSMPSNKESFTELSNVDINEVRRRRETPTIVEHSTDTVPLKFDNDKTDWAILPFSSIEEIVKVLKFGETKYARGNFAVGKGLGYLRLINASIRHIIAFARGEDNDPESGLNHIAHAACCLVFLLYYIKHPSKYPDDRESNILK